MSVYQKIEIPLNLFLEVRESLFWIDLRGAENYEIMRIKGGRMSRGFGQEDKKVLVKEKKNEKWIQEQ